MLLVAAVLVGSAQSEVPNFRKNTKHKDNTEQVSKDKTDKAAPSINQSNATSDGEYTILRKAIENAFLIVKANYNVRDRESGTNVSGTDFFGTVYSVVPLLSCGYGVDSRFLEPWKSDPKYDANKYGDNLVSVDKLEYKRPKDTAFIPYTMNRTTDQTLAPGFFHVTDSSFKNLGLRVELGNGVKSGYMVWFRVNPETGETSYYIYSTSVTFNENSIFNVRQPAEPETVIGGAFLNLNADEPGCLRLNLMAIARVDPYGGQKWELVKMQTYPDVPVGAQPASSNQKAGKSETSGSDDSIIPEQDNGKNKKKGKKSK